MVSDSLISLFPGTDTDADALELVEDGGSDDHDVLDVRDMVVVHTALLREFGLAPAAVERVSDGDRRQARAVVGHLTLLSTLLHDHHSAQDDLLLPVLGSRLPTTDRTLLAAAETQHGGVERALREVIVHRDIWVDFADLPTRAELADALRDLHGLLAEHFEAEQRTVLPLAAAHLDAAEWRAIGAAGAAGVSPRQLPLVLGMFAYEGDPGVLADIIHSAPAPIRPILRRWGPRAYARHALAIHGSRQPWRGAG